MKSWFQRFMSGRYGNDQLGNFLCIASLAFLLLGFVWGFFYFIGMVALIYCYYRMLSRNMTKRYAENKWYLDKRSVLQNWFATQKLHFDMRNTYRYYHCPHCHQELRVPRGRGRISITCPKCHTSFIKKS